MKKTEKSRWDKLDDLRQEQAIAGDEIPAEAFTVTEYAERYELPYATASGQIRKLARTGKLKCGVALGRDHTGGRRPMKFFWLPEEA
jgi:hypothetical protein